MKLKALHKAIAALLPLAILASCEDSTSPIGGSLVNGEVSITVDTLEMKLDASSIMEPEFDSCALRQNCSDA